ncbi:hypothetical protein CI109_102281 [Kwoniella shandongensis]|uniref:Uncharacterized protein n=1 Tax=Kwoniella shandongensis TaxID=1734106 RepID=A0A5M6BYY0_9TREE|nr:uncharacterized protein CI109_003565 [Kwoniella shandongensis]KAA5527913.1 hypothetical protein CI109_003565 [Kwoniella shandongensis]
MHNANPLLNPSQSTTSSSKPIPSAPSTTTTTASTSSLSSTFGTPKSSIGRKKPPGLDISKSILKPTRAAPGLPGSTNSSKSPEEDVYISEADRLREDIAKLQLSSRSTSSTASPDSPVAAHHSDSSTASASASASATSQSGTSGKEKSSSKKKKSSKHKDKDGGGGPGGEDLVKDEDLDMLQDLGAGNGGTVTKVWNKKRGCVMARKLILVDAKPSVRKQILRELQIMNDCSSPYIVGYYGCFPVDVHVGIVMEYMDAGSLDYIYRPNGSISIDIVGKVAEAVLHGLMYLYDVHRIIHRDIKPSNILANTAGEIKICDFGVSGELINSIANTFVGTSTYMSPERIQGAPYTIKSDVWSLGISLIELALGRFPFSDSPESEPDGPPSPTASEYDPDPTLPLSTQRPKLNSDGSAKRERRRSQGVSLGGGGHTMSILDLLQHIVNEPAPRLVSRRKTFPQEAVIFVEGCLYKDPGERKSPQDLLAMDWITKSTVTKEDLRSWALSTINPDQD